MLLYRQKISAALLWPEPGKAFYTETRRNPLDSLILVLHIIVCVLLIILVLLQSGKEGMGVIFGGGNSSLFGSSGAGGILVKLTTFVAIIFLCTSLGYNIVSSADKTGTSRVSASVTDTSK